MLLQRRPIVAKKKKKTKSSGLVKYDVVSDSIADEDGSLSKKIVGCLFQKGYCVANLGVGHELLSSALKDASRLEADAPERFEVPAVEVADGLLGEEGSSQVLELDVPLDGVGLQKADAHFSRIFDLLLPLQGELGVEAQGRSKGLLHVAGCAEDDPPRLTEVECQRWLRQFGRHRLMLILVLGPAGGKLELAPFDEEANPIELHVEPGSTVLLRADALSHRFSSTARSLVLTCWLNQESVHNARFGGDEAVVISPQYAELAAWKQQRLAELKDGQVVGDEGQEWDPAVPREWQAEANRMFHSGPQVGIRSLAGKLPQTYSADGFWFALANGMDFATTVPFTRWSHEDVYDPNPQSWKMSKSCCRHAVFVDGLEFFDCKFFGISPFEAKGMDPNQRHILETSYDALHGAGFTKKQLMRSLIGVYIGAAVSEFSLVPVSAESTGATSGANSITSNRISFCLGMQGPSYTLDNQGASSLSVLTAATLSLRMQTKNYRPNHTCLIGATYLQLGAATWVLASAQGWLSQQGRCFNFDNSADGYIKGDLVANAVLSPLSERIDGEDVVDDSRPLLGTVAACGMSHTGRGASLTAPSGPQERELVFDALRQASIGATDIDAVECWGDGSMLREAVEVEALRTALRGEADAYEVPLAIASGKSQFGNMWESAGMASLIRVLVGQRHSMLAPGLHLFELNPHLDIWSGDAPLLLGSEPISYRGPSSYHGITGKSIGGVMTHVITFAWAPNALPPAPALQALPFWPAGGGALAADVAPGSGEPYQILGSWSEWSRPQPMHSEGGGVYGSTIALGPNGFEQFQISLDGHMDRILHPAWPESPSGAAVMGPAASDECADLRWTIDGAGKPHGSLVRVRLRVAGKWRAVDWEPVPEGGGGATAREVDAGRYYIVGSFNDWTFKDELRPVGAGLFRAEVGPLPWAGGHFQVARNQDWRQTFHPGSPEADTTSAVLGPSPCPEELCWRLGGLQGDVFQVDFRRDVDASGSDERSIAWTRLSSGR